MSPPLLDDIYRCTFQQEDQLRWMTRDPGVSSVSGLMIAVESPLDEDRLRRSLTALVARHPALRTSISPGGPHDPDVSCHVWRALPELPVDVDAKPTRLSDLAARAFTRFDINRPPLWRVLSSPAESGQTHLAFAVDHMVFDASSATILLNDLRIAYRSPDQPFPPLLSTYGQYARWQRSEQARREFADDIGHWERVLSGTPLERPVPVAGFDPVAALASIGEQASDVLVLDGQLWQGTLRQRGRLAASAFHIIAALLAESLGALSSTRDLTILCPVQARQPEYRDVLGWFANQLPLRVRWSPGTTTSDLVTIVRDQTIAALQHGLVPWEFLRPHFGLDPDEAEVEGLVQLNALYTDAPREASQRDGWRRVTMAPASMRQTGLDIRAHIGTTAAKLTCYYPRGGYPGQVIGSLLTGIRDGAARIAAAGLARPS
jgi:hypothetical protein